ncbi:unnamed protein product [Ranitomeya imitator]|uniref:peptide-methionine (S)-S-oxide reductase n=1 Tax=Ranitomeya imitator TaxID=111125 RepID=A0ABN9MBF6_9NEOB|nr:unnamed protein product [Ranitomeya imitator]
MICTDAQNLCESDPGPDEEGSQHNVDPRSQTVTPVGGDKEEDDDETEIPDWNENLTFRSGQEEVGSEDDGCENTQDDDDEVVDPTYCQPPVHQSMRSAEEKEEDASDKSDDEVDYHVFSHCGESFGPRHKKSSRVPLTNFLTRLIASSKEVQYIELYLVPRMKQGKEIGTQYRSVIFTYSDQQREAALQSIDSYQKELKHCNLGAITTEILPVPEFYYAEDYHQQYLQKIPDGYCGLKGTGVSCVL